MKFTLSFILVNAVTLFLVLQCDGQLAIPNHENRINPSKTNFPLKKGESEKLKKERIFLGDDSLSFGYANAKFSLGGGLNGLGGFGAYYRPSFYGHHHHLGGGGLYGGGNFGGNFGGIGFGLSLPYKFHHHHHQHHRFHQYHHGFSGFSGYQHQPFFPGFGYY